MRCFVCLCAVSAVFFVFDVAVLDAKQCELQISTAKSVLPSGKKQTTCLKVGIKGFELPSEKERVPVNVAMVIDRSGSMQGKKIERAREAAVQALRQLGSKDIVSVVVFDDNIDVVVPATLGGSERLKRSAVMNRRQSTEINSPAWHSARKKMVESQNTIQLQQNYWVSK
jgi:hypothetical protein